MSECLHIDLETRSACDLRTRGVYRYAEDPTTEVILMSYRFDQEPVLRFTPDEQTHAPLQGRLLHHIGVGGKVLAHNANFERQLWNQVLRRDYPHWPRLEISQCDCTQARGLAVHLPADLDTLAVVLGLTEKKDDEGHRLMMKMCRPRKVHADGTITWWEDPSMIERLGSYCDQDVRVESAADEKLPPLSAEERRLWELDQLVNDRGILIDGPTVERCVEVLEVAQERANTKMAILTNGFVKKCTEVTRIIDWLKGRGLPCDSIAKGKMDELKTYADCLGDDLAREVIELRAEAGRASTAKFQKMLDCRCADGRVRGMFGFHQALTGRWGGKLLQPHNLAGFEDYEKDWFPDVMAAIQIMMDAA